MEKNDRKKGSKKKNSNKKFDWVRLAVEEVFKGESFADWYNSKDNS